MDDGQKVPSRRGLAALAFALVTAVALIGSAPAEAAAGEAPVAFEGTTNGALTVAVTDSTATISLTAVATGKPVTGATLDVGPLVVQGTPTSVLPTVAVDGTAFDPAKQKLDIGSAGTEITLTAKLPQLGTYTGNVSIVAGGTRVPLALTVTSSSPANPALPTVSVVVPLPTLTGDTVDVTLRATGKGQATVQPPTIENTRLIQSTDFESAQEVDISSCLVPDEGTADDKGGDDGAPCEPFDQLTLSQGDVATVRVTIAGVRDPGSYTGTLRFTVVGADQDVTAAVKMTRRDPVWLAFGVLLIGALLAEFVRLAVASFKPRLEAQSVLSDWADELDRVIASLPPDRAALPEVRGAADAVRTGLRLLTAAVRRGGLATADAKTKTDSLEGRLAVLPPFAEAVAQARDRGVLQDARGDVDALVAYIGNGIGTDSAERLTALRERTMVGLTEAAVDAFDQQLALRAGTLPEATEASRVEAAAQAAEARKQLAAKAIPSAKTAYERARSLWAEALFRMARTALADRPAQADASTWERVEDDLRKLQLDQLDPSEVDAAIVPILVRVGVLVQQAYAKELPPGPPTPDPAKSQEDQAKKAQEKALLDQAVARLADAIRSGDAGVIATAVETARDARRTYLDEPEPAAGLEFGPNLSSEVALAAPAPPAEQPTVDEAAVVIPTGAAVRENLLWLNLGVFLVAAAAAIASGLLFLYAPNHGWGSLTDVLIMFVWAIGIHEVAGVTAASGIRKKVAGGLTD